MLALNSDIEPPCPLSAISIDCAPCHRIIGETASRTEEAQCRDAVPCPPYRRRPIPRHRLTPDADQRDQTHQTASAEGAITATAPARLAPKSGFVPAQATCDWANWKGTHFVPAPPSREFLRTSIPHLHRAGYPRQPQQRSRHRSNLRLEARARLGNRQMEPAQLTKDHQGEQSVTGFRRRSSGSPVLRDAARVPAPAVGAKDTDRNEGLIPFTRSIPHQGLTTFPGFFVAV